MDKDTNKVTAIYDLYVNGLIKEFSISNFQKKIFDAFTYADGSNRKKLANAFPEYFKDSELLT